MLQSCPWARFAPGTIHFCEERLCAWIVEPANTWSNLAYIAIGIFLLSRASKVFGISAILIGIFSFAFHATGTLWGEFLDLTSMYLLSSVCLTVNLVRGGHLHNFRWWVVVALVLTSAGIFMLDPRLGIPVFAAHLAVMFIFELYVFKTSKARLEYRPLVIASILFIVAHIIWQLDFHKIACLPKNHFIQGHAAWHVITAISIIFLDQFYGQFRSGKGRKND